MAPLPEKLVASLQSLLGKKLVFGTWTLSDDDNNAAVSASFEATLGTLVFVHDDDDDDDDDDDCHACSSRFEEAK